MLRLARNGHLGSGAMAPLREPSSALSPFQAEPTHFAPPRNPITQTSRTLSLSPPTSCPTSSLTPHPSLAPFPISAPPPPPSYTSKRRTAAPPTNKAVSHKQLAANRANAAHS